MGPPAFSSLAPALDWLDGHVNYESAMPQRRALPTLDVMRELATLLGEPQGTAPAIHVTGTNGKGSTAAMLTALLGAHGLSVGTYTSPDLGRVNERLARSGLPIDDRSFTEILTTLALLEPHLSAPPTRFELLTAAALRWFSDEAVDAMVVEVGVGGTWDSTNVIDAAVAVITNIGLDHTDILGPTLAGIASDKAGIAKAGSTVVVGETDPELAGIIAERARQAGAASLWQMGRDFACRTNALAVGGRVTEIHTPGGVYPDLFLPLHGAHQGANAACALAAAEAFFGGPLDPTTVQDAFARVAVPGRLEVVGRRPLVLLDGAHNPPGMAALAASLIEEFSVPGPVVLVAGMLTGRDPRAMLGACQGVGLAAVVACPPPSPRAMEVEAVVEAAATFGLSAEPASSVRAALVRAQQIAGPEGMVVVAGSLYTVAAARAVLLDASPATPPAPQAG